MRSAASVVTENSAGQTARDRDELGSRGAPGADLGHMRWLTVRVPGDDPERVILLEKPGPPAMDAKTAEQTRELIAKGASGFTLGFSTDDARKTYEEFKAKGVEMTDGPTEQPYGIDFGARDPFGNHFRVSQPASF